MPPSGRGFAGPVTAADAPVALDFKPAPLGAAEATPGSVGEGHGQDPQAHRQRYNSLK